MDLLKKKEKIENCKTILKDLIDNILIELHNNNIFIQQLTNNIYQFKLFLNFTKIFIMEDFKKIIEFYKIVKKKINYDKKTIKIINVKYGDISIYYNPEESKINDNIIKIINTKKELLVYKLNELKILYNDLTILYKNKDNTKIDTNILSDNSMTKLYIVFKNIIELHNIIYHSNKINKLAFQYYELFKKLI
jgi:hypothetical protein